MREIVETALDLIKASVAPAVTATALFLCCARWIAARETVGRLLGLAFAVAYLVGHAVWVARPDLVPSRNWHWMPYLALAAAIVGWLSALDRLRLWLRWLLVVAMSFLAAWLLTPNWPTLWPPWIVCIPLLSMYFLLLTTLLEPLAGRTSSSIFLAALAVAAAALAALLTAMSDLTYGQLAAVAAAALAGYTVAIWLTQRKESARGLSLVYAVTVGGWAFVGAAYPQPPLYGLLLVPTAPAVALWGWLAYRSHQ